MRRDVAPHDQVEQLTPTETIDAEPTEATDDELFAYVSGRVGHTGRVGRTGRVAAESLVGPSEPDWLVEVFVLPALEPPADDDAAGAPASVVEPARVEDAFWSVRISSEATSRR